MADLEEIAAIVLGGFVSGNVFDFITDFLRGLGLDAEDELKIGGVALSVIASYLAADQIGGRTGELVSKFLLGVAAGIAGDPPVTHSHVAGVIA